MEATTKISKVDGEYRVRLFIDGEYQAGADYFTDDKQDAQDTAAHMAANAKHEFDTIAQELDAETAAIRASEQADYDNEQLVCAAPVTSTSVMHNSQWRELETASDEFGERNDCTVKALALACDIPYEQAHAEMAATGRKNGRGHYYFSLNKAIQAHGKTLVKIDPEEFIAKYPKPHFNLKSVTTHHPDRFKKVWKDGNTYLFYTTRMAHVCVIKDGEMIDWTKGRAMRCDSIYRVEG